MKDGEGPSGLRDRFSRVIDYMRVSVTDRCNLRCLYCMPGRGVRPIVRREILAYEEIVRILTVAASLGVNRVRLTGGEPLARKDFQTLVGKLSMIEGIEDITLTTNGTLLQEYAARLRDAGLKRVNVSLDSLRPERYREITRGGDLDVVLKGLKRAEDEGLTPVKINMVPVRGINDDEIPDFARLTIETSYHVRFIELMPIGETSINEGLRIPGEEVMERVRTLGELTPVRVRRHGPAKYYRLPGARGVIGFISAMTHHFCRDCNRLRLTADGKLRPCLFSETEIDLKSPIRKGCSDDEIERLLRLAIEIKPEGHYIIERASGRRPMSRIGG